MNTSKKRVCSLFSEQKKNGLAMCDRSFLWRETKTCHSCNRSLSKLSPNRVRLHFLCQQSVLRIREPSPAQKSPTPCFHYSFRLLTNQALCEAKVKFSNAKSHKICLRLLPGTCLKRSDSVRSPCAHMFFAQAESAALPLAAFSKDLHLLKIRISIEIT